MKEKITLLKGLFRHRCNRISADELSRALTFIHLQLESVQINEFAIYLSGSHNPKGRKYPNRWSDIDLYVVIDGKMPAIEEWIDMSKMLKMATGKKYQVFLVNKLYEEVTCTGMSLQLRR